MVRKYADMTLKDLVKVEIPVAGSDDNECIVRTHYPCIRDDKNIEFLAEPKLMISVGPDNKP